MKLGKLGLLAAMSLGSFVSKSAFAANVAVVHVGTGQAALSNAATPISLDIYTTGGSALGSVAVQQTGSTALNLSGTASSEGALTLSGDGSRLVFAGYNAAAGTTGVATSSSATVSRVIGTVDDSNAAYTLAATYGTTTTNSYSGNNIRSAVTQDGTQYYGAGGTAGTVSPASPSNVVIQSSSTNTRVTSIFGGKLYFSTGSGTSGVYSLGATPTSAATATALFATGAGSSPYEFFVAGDESYAYVADDRTSASGGVQKWTNTGGTWSLAYTLSTSTGGTTNSGARGLSIDISGTNPVVYATTVETSANRLVSIVDTGASSVASLLSTAATNTVFRGVELTDIEATALPEPSSLAVIGLGGLGLLRRRRAAR